MTRAAVISVNIEYSSLRKKLAGIKHKDMPRAVRNTVRDIMKDTRAREIREMKKVFDKPVKLLTGKRGLVYVKYPQLVDPSGVLGFSDVYGDKGQAVLRAVSPHIPGYDNTRHHKGMEVALIADGKMSKDEYLMPSRTMKLNGYGNITGHMASKMLSDIGTTERNTQVRSKTGNAKAQFVWAELKTKRGGTVKGIWYISRLRNKSGFKNALAMVVVSKRPTYAKRFRFKEIAKSWGDKRAPYFARKTVDHYIKRKYGG